MVQFTLENRGVIYQNQQKEIVLKNNETVEQGLKKHLSKYKVAMNLGSRYSFEIIGKELIGYAN